MPSPKRGQPAAVKPKPKRFRGTAAKLRSGLRAASCPSYRVSQTDAAGPKQ